MRRIKVLVIRLTNFTLNSNSQLQIVSPVILVLANGTTLNASAGSSGNPSWLTVKVATGAVTPTAVALYMAN